MSYYPPPGGYPPPGMPGYPQQPPMMMPGGYAQPPPQMMYPQQPPMMMPGGYPQPPMPMPMAGGFPAGYPVFTGALAPNMYYKPVWTPKREMKLQRLWYQVTRDGCITWNEVIRILHGFHYHVNPYEAQWFYATLDRNRDGRIDYAELRQAMMEFIVRYPRMRNPCKRMMKAHYAMGFNWAVHPMFPQHFGHMWHGHHHH